MVCCGCCLCAAFFCEMAIRSVIISPLSKWECRHRYTPGLFQCVEHMDTNGVRRGKGERERERWKERAEVGGRAGRRPSIASSPKSTEHQAPRLGVWWLCVVNESLQGSGVGMRRR